jgi:hypothetical protein
MIRRALAAIAAVPIGLAVVGAVLVLQLVTGLPWRSGGLEGR